MRRSIPILRCSIRLVSINDVYELTNLPRLRSLLSRLSPPASAVLLCGDFLSPSTLSSIDGGRGMVRTLRAAGVTHASLGNHEADIPLHALNARVRELRRGVTTTTKVLNTNMRPAPNETAMDLALYDRHALVRSPCGAATVALLGLMSDEPDMFRDGTFKGVPIADVLSSFEEEAAALPPGVNAVLPMTHQSVARDRELAERMAGHPLSAGVVVGGHEHDLIDETVRGVRIVKTGFDAQSCAVIDLRFGDGGELEGTDVAFEDVTSYKADSAVQAVADKQLLVIRAMEDEVVIDEVMVPKEVTLASERTRFQQTSVGAFFCSAVKDEMEADVCLINGASIKGGNVYENNRMTYAQLKKELPFPTKIVLARLTLREVVESVHYSRTCEVEGAEPGEQPARRGYMQVNFSFLEEFGDALETGVLPPDVDGERMLKVALPRNLMAGFCDIKPLIAAGKRLKAAKTFPNADDFIPALLLVTRHCCLERWLQISQLTTFEMIDANHDGVLDREEITAMMRRVLGHEPEEFVVDDMIASIDLDGDGLIDHHEFDVLLSKAAALKKKPSHRQT